MGQSWGALAFVLSVGAIALAGYAALREPEATADDHRLTALEAQLDRIERTLAEQAGATRRSTRNIPLLRGPSSLPGTNASSESASATSTAPNITDTDDKSESTSPPSEVIRELVDAAVAKKAAQIQQMRNKKPTMDAFAGVLSLTAAQREAAQEEIVRAQRGIREVLELPADDGTDFLQAVVDTMALGMAKPAESGAAWAKLIGRLTSETVPGSNVTYAKAVDEIKANLRDTFRRTWRPEQYATFETWRMDPTEVRGIEGSPWQDLEARIAQRAEELKPR